MTASLADLTIADGVAADGGGVYSLGNLTVTGDVFIGNTATASGPYGYPAAGGGAIFSIDGTLVVSNSTFTNNRRRPAAAVPSSRPCPTTRTRSAA